jgi:hypothetical protein
LKKGGNPDNNNELTLELNQLTVNIVNEMVQELYNEIDQELVSIQHKFLTGNNVNLNKLLRNKIKLIQNQNIY